MLRVRLRLGVWKPERLASGWPPRFRSAGPLQQLQKGSVAILDLSSRKTWWIAVVRVFLGVLPVLRLSTAVATCTIEWPRGVGYKRSKLCQRLRITPCSIQAAPANPCPKALSPKGPCVGSPRAWAEVPKPQRPLYPCHLMSRVDIRLALAAFGGSLRLQPFLAFGRKTGSGASIANCRDWRSTNPILVIKVPVAVTEASGLRMKPSLIHSQRVYCVHPELTLIAHLYRWQ